MIVKDAGHVYKLATLDGDEEQLLTFVKRVGENFPGNLNAHSGTTCQEVIRALIDRITYVNNQINFPENKEILEHLRWALYKLEVRAKKVRGESMIGGPDNIDKLTPCPTCLHVFCTRHTTTTGQAAS